MITINKHKFVALLLAVSLLLSQLSTAVNGFIASAKEADNMLVIRHIAKTPEGREYVLGIEEIENITDIYYYRASVSPVASEFLRNGYSLSNEKNGLIEADIVTNGGKIDLEYTPSVQSVNVTYYRNEGGAETRMGAITDSAYVGEEYNPLLPVYEGADVLAELVGNEKYIVKYGDNDFKVSYAVKKAQKEQEHETGSSGYGEGKGALLSPIRLNRDGGYVVGYPNNTFRPEEKIVKKELFSILYAISGGNYQDEPPSSASVTAFLEENKIIPEGIGDPGDFVTWAEFYGYMEKLNQKLPSGEQIANLGSDYWIRYFEETRYVKRAEAVAVINEMLGIDKNVGFSRSSARNGSESLFSDVDKNYWAYNDIMKAIH